MGEFVETLSCVILELFPPNTPSDIFWESIVEILIAIQFLSDIGLVWPWNATFRKGCINLGQGGQVLGEAQGWAISTSAHASPTLYQIPRNGPEPGKRPPFSFSQLLHLENGSSIFLVIYVPSCVLGGKIGLDHTRPTFCFAFNYDIFQANQKKIYNK